MKVSLIVVCHHSSGVLPGCAASFRRQVAAAGCDGEIVAVEQSEDADELAAAAAIDPDLLLERPNRGYAAGLNAGVAEATGEILLLANPDITFLEDSVAALVDAVRGGADVVGPQLLWDQRGEVMLPIPDDPGVTAELARTARRRWPALRSDVSLIERSWRVWTASEPLPVPSLRGPALALSRSAARRFGPLDEGYFLYYEETEWLLRARRSGARLRLAPGARVIHRWGHATERCDGLAAIEERSRRRFFERNYPTWGRLLLQRLAPKRPLGDAAFAVVGGPGDLPAVSADVWLLSIVSQMEPAVGCLAAETLPPAARELSARGRWYALAAGRRRDRWRVLGRWTWERR